MHIMMMRLSLLVIQALTARGMSVRPGLVPKDAHALSDCLDAAGVSYVDSRAKAWADAIKPYNRRMPVTPDAVVYATTAEHVQDSVLCAIENGLKVSAKSGGHSYATYGLGGDDGHLVIQLDHMYGVELQNDGTANVTAGTRLGYSSLELYEQGKRDFAHGTCPSVGLGGHVGMGGYGFSSHNHGLALDSVVSARVVLANGTLVHVSEDENQDLFWAIRGASPSFGIVVDYKFKAFEVPEVSTWMLVASGLRSGTKAEAVANIRSWQDILVNEGMDEKLNMRLLLKGAESALQVVYHGPKEEALKALAPFKEVLTLDFSQATLQFGQGNWTNTLLAWAGDDPLNITYPYEKQAYSYTSSVMPKAMPDSAISAFVDMYFDKGKAADAPSWWMLMDVYGDLNSRVTKVAVNATAYPHRDKLWLLQFSANMKDAADVEPGMKFVKDFMGAVTDNMDDDDWGRYANYVDSELSRDEAEKKYWGANLPRLKELKARYDPEGVFANPQSIEPSSDA